MSFNRLAALGLCFACVIAFSTFSINSEAEDRSEDGAVSLKDFRISGPYTHENLSIFLFHGADTLKGQKYISLSEGIKAEKVIIHETSDVQNLKISNNSKDEFLYIQAGSIIKGGKQDRVLSTDAIIPPKTKNLDISSFCVEQGRWSGRSDVKDAGKFYGNDKMLPGKQLKIAAKVQKDQGEVWSNVSDNQARLGRNLGLIKKSKQPKNTADINRRTRSGQRQNLAQNSSNDLTVVSTLNALVENESPSSLQLALEHEKLEAELKKFREKFKKTVSKHQDVLGFAFSINGQFNSFDLYGSNQLFQKLWPQLLDAAATEAISFNDEEKQGETSKEDIRAAIRDAMKAKTERSDSSKHTRYLKNDSEKNVLFRTRDEEGNLIHWNLMKY